MENNHQFDDPSIAQKPVSAAKLERTRHPVAIEHIDVNPDRFRKVSEEDIDKIAESMRQLGQLQPIGVRIMPVVERTTSFQLIYGLSRLMAAKKNGNGIIEAVIFQLDTTDDQAKLFEIAENYHRTELTPEERTEHMLKYAALLKKTGAVRSRREKQAKTQTKGAPNVSTGNISAETEKPTMTEAVSKEMGINRHTVHKRTKKAIETAKAHGVDVDASATMETMDAETLDAVADAVSREADAETLEPNSAVPPEPELEKAAKSRDASNRKDLTDEVADDVRAALERVWHDSGPDVDWAMFAAAVRRFLKTGVQS